MKNKINDIKQNYDDFGKKLKESYKNEHQWFKKACKFCWCWFCFPWLWAWNNLRDWQTWLIFVIVFLVVSCEVWVPYLVALIIGVKTPLGISMMSVASACWLFWIGPGTPFMVVCISATIGVKALINKIKRKKTKEE